MHRPAPTLTAALLLALPLGGCSYLWPEGDNPNDDTATTRSPSTVT